MKVTADQIKMAVVRYIDSEIANRLEGWRKWAVPVGAAALVNNKIDALGSGRNADMLMSLGYMTEDGLYDIDKIYEDFLSIAREKGSITETLPLIGAVTFSAQDIEILRRHFN